MVSFSDGALSACMVVRDFVRVLDGMLPDDKDSLLERLDDAVGICEEMVSLRGAPGPTYRGSVLVV